MRQTPAPVAILAACTGCGVAPIHYSAHSEGGEPYLSPPIGSIAYAGGHLCPNCASVVAAALRKERSR